MRGAMLHPAAILQQEHSARGGPHFLKAIEAALTASAPIGPLTNWSMSSFGMDGSAAAAAACVA